MARFGGNIPTWTAAVVLTDNELFSLLMKYILIRKYNLMLFLLSQVLFESINS